MVDYFLDYINTKHRAENFDDDNNDASGTENADHELYDGIDIEDDGKKETPFHIKMVVEVRVRSHQNLARAFTRASAFANVWVSLLMVPIWTGTGWGSRGITVLDLRKIINWSGWTS